MFDMDYVCLICHKKLGGEFRARMSHTSLCAAKNNIDAEKMGQLKRQHEASLLAERAAWEERHPEFARGEMSTSQPTVDAPSREKAPRKPRKVTSTAIAAHAEQQAAQSVLRMFYPSQMLEDHLSPNSSVASHQLTWESNDTPEREPLDEPIDSPFGPSSRPPPSLAPPLKSIGLGECDSDWERDDVLDARQSTQLAKQSRFAPTALSAAFLPPNDLMTMERDDIWDVAPTQYPKRGEKRRAEEELLSSPEAFSKKPKSAESTSPHTKSTALAGIIVLDSPTDSQEIPKHVPPQANAEEMPPVETDSMIVIGNQISVAGLDSSQSEDSDDNEFWLRSTTGKVIRPETFLPTNYSAVQSVTIETGFASFDARRIPEDTEIYSSPPTPPLDRCTTPPRSTRVSMADDFIDLSSPVRVVLPKAVQISLSISSESTASRIANPPKPAEIPLVAPSEPPTTRKADEPALVTDEMLAFHSALDAIIKKFHQLEKDAEQRYHTSIGQLSKQKEEQIRELARHRSIDMASAMCAFHIRSAEFTASSTSTVASPVRIQAPSANAANATNAQLTSSAPLFGPLPIPTPSSQATIDIQTSNVSTAAQVHGLGNVSTRPAAPVLAYSSDKPVQPVSTSSNVSRTNSRTIVNDRASNTSANQCPNFQGMSNTQLSALASKYSLPTNVSRSTLESQLSVLWQYHKTQANEIAAEPSNSALTATSSSSSLSLSRNGTTRLEEDNTTAVNSNATISVPTAKRTRAKKASTATTSAAVPSSSSANGSTTSHDNTDPSFAINQRLDSFVKSNVDLYAKLLHYISVDILEFQALLKESKIKISRQDLTHYLQSRGFLYTLKKTASGKAVTSAKR
jgi:hypothetical protein